MDLAFTWAGGKILAFCEDETNPTANDAKNNGNLSRANRHSLGLNGTVGGSLNPEWVEIFMGFPQVWTE